MLGSAHGMQTLNQSLTDSVKNGYITEEVGLTASHDKEEFRRLMQ